MFGLLMIVWLVGMIAAIVFIVKPNPKFWPVASRKRALVSLIAVLVGVPILASPFAPPSEATAEPGNSEESDDKDGAGASDEPAEPAPVRIDYGGTRLDSAKVAGVAELGSLKAVKDDFSGTTCYTGRNAPQYRNANGVFGRFCINDGYLSPLSLNFQYYNDEWLFISGWTVKIGERLVDGRGNFERDNGIDGNGARIFEWHEREVGEDEVDLMRAIAENKGATIRYFGQQYRDDRTINAAAAQGLADVLDAYEALYRQARP